MQAALYGHSKSLGLLLGFGAQFDTGDSEGNTSLHESSCCGSLLTTQLLIDHGANVNVKNMEGNDKD